MGAMRNSQSVKSVTHIISVKLLVVIYIIAVSAIMIDAARGSRRRRTKTSTTDELVVNLTLVERAADIGAFCLDGSLPAYRLDRGHGSGANIGSYNLRAEDGVMTQNPALLDKQPTGVHPITCPNMLRFRAF